MPKYVIEDLEGFAKHIRENVAKSFTETYEENLDEFISINQIIKIVEENTKNKNEKGQFIITGKKFDNIFDSIRVWMYEVGLARLAAKDIVQCAWDDENNEMVFWLPNNDKTNIPTKPSSD